MKKTAFFCLFATFAGMSFFFSCGQGGFGFIGPPQPEPEPEPLPLFSGLNITINTAENAWVAGKSISLTFAAMKDGFVDTEYTGQKFVTISDFEAAPIAKDSFGSFNGIILTKTSGNSISLNFKAGVVTNVILRLNMAGRQKLYFEAEGVASATLDFTILAADAESMKIITPAKMSARSFEETEEDFSTSPVIGVFDVYGNPCPDIKVTVDLTVNTYINDDGTFSSRLYNNSTVTDDSGEADFTYLTIRSNGQIGDADIVYTAKGISIVQSGFSWTS